MPLSSGYRRKASTRLLQRAELVVREGVRFIDGELPRIRATRWYAAGARVRIDSKAGRYFGTIERTAGLGDVQRLVIRVSA